MALFLNLPSFELENVIQNMSRKDLKNLILAEPELETLIDNLPTYQKNLIVWAQVDFFMERMKKMCNQEVSIISFDWTDDFSKLGIRTSGFNDILNIDPNVVCYLNWSPILEKYVINFDDSNFESRFLDKEDFFELMVPFYNKLEKEFKNYYDIQMPKYENADYDMPDFLMWQDFHISINVAQDLFLKVVFENMGIHFILPDNQVDILKYHPVYEFIKKENLKHKIFIGDYPEVYIDNETFGHNETHTLKGAQEIYDLINILVTNNIVPYVRFNNIKYKMPLYSAELAVYKRAEFN